MAVADNSSQQQAWLEMQAEYWQIWQKVALQLLKSSMVSSSSNQQNTANDCHTKNNNDDAADPNAKTDTLNWWQTAGMELFATETAQQTVQHFIKQSKNYLAFSEIFVEIIEKMPALEKESHQWQHLWEDGFNAWEAKLTDWLPDALNPASVWALPLDSWMRTISSLSGLPGDLFQASRHDLNSATTSGTSAPKLRELMSILGLGYTGKWQAQYQEGLRRWQAYQQAQQEYTGQYQELTTQALQRLRDKVLTSSTQTPITDLRTLYDLWLETSETTYAELVSSDAYAEKNANLVNSLMAWKQHQQQMMDELLSALHMPTRREFNSLSQRLHALRRETRCLQITEEHEPSQLDELRQEINALRAELTSLKSTHTKAKTTTGRTRRPRKLAAVDDASINQPDKQKPPAEPTGD